MTLSVGPQGPSLPALLSGVGEVLIYHLQWVVWTGQGSRKEAECPVGEESLLASPDGQPAPALCPVRFFPAGPSPRVGLSPFDPLPSTETVSPGPVTQVGMQC